MTDFGGDAAIGGTTPSSRTDADGRWWSEPDPVEVFAAGLELALRQLRVEVAGLRAERDGLRLEVEGLRAKLMIAHEQLASRESLADTVRQLQAAVARLTAQQAAPPAAPPPPAEPVIVLPPAEPFVMPPAEPFVVAPSAEPPAPVDDTPEPPAAVRAPEPAPAAPSEPSALDQLKAMGLWPPRGAAAPVVPPPVDAPPAPERRVDPDPRPEVETEPEPIADRPRPAPPTATPSDTVISWDRASTRRVPVVIEDQPFTVPEAEDAPRRGRGRAVLTVLTGGLGALLVLTVLLVSVGPHVLPYQTYFVRSGSMAPTIDTGAMVVLTKVDAEDLEAGDIITFKNPDREDVLVTHRIVSVETGEGGREFVTKGDANTDVDPWRVPASGTGWRYALDVPYLGYVFGYLSTAQARLALLVIPAAILGLLALLDVWRPRPEES